MLTSKEYTYLKTLPVITDIHNVKHRLYYMLIKDCDTVRPLLETISDIIGLPYNYDNKYYTLEQQVEAMVKLLVLSLSNKVSEQDVSNNFTFDMAKKIIINYIGGNIDMKIETGCVIVDRYGVEHKAHSVLLKDMDKIRELLPMVDSVVTVNNVLNVDNEGNFSDVAYEALLSIIQMTLDGDLTREEIESWLDAEICRKLIRVALDLPMVG